jgi:hypothetical protein
MHYLFYTKPKLGFMSTHLFAGVNWLAVLVAAIAYFMLGALWYGTLFQKKWVAYQGIDMNDPEVKKDPAPSWRFRFS